MPKLISPTPGRVVWFHPHKTDSLHFSDQPLAATVAYVWSDRLVNLGVTDSNGGHHGRTSVVLLQEDDPRPADGGYAEWMPYQLGQAAKTEVVQAAPAPVEVPPGSPTVATGAGDHETDGCA